jgi:hypothetical protein
MAFICVQNYITFHSHIKASDNRFSKTFQTLENTSINFQNFPKPLRTLYMSDILISLSGKLKCLSKKKICFI